MKDTNYRRAMRYYVITFTGLIVLYLEMWFMFTHVWGKNLPVDRFIVSAIVALITSIIVIRSGNRAEKLYWKWKRGF